MKGLRRWWASWRRKWRQRLNAIKAPGRFLCDSCRYDYGHACRRPERPNATRCPEYRPR